MSIGDSFDRRAGSSSLAISGDDSRERSSPLVATSSRCTMHPRDWEETKGEGSDLAASTIGLGIGRTIVSTNLYD
jgi:hypothetical protein